MNDCSSAHSAIRHLKHITMRTYGKNWTYKATTTFKQRQVRLATEWDIRLDVGDSLPVEEIINNCKNIKDDVLYVLVSGVESPDRVEDQVESNTNRYGQRIHTTAGSRSVGEHVHVCLVLLEPKNRADVLCMLRGKRKVLDEYAAPRDPKFAYAGWVIHHAKLDWKIPGEPGIRFEHGTLPMDPITTDWAVKIHGICKKWGSDVMRKRFKVYLDLIAKNNTMEKIERLMMSMEDQEH